MSPKKEERELGEVAERLRKRYGNLWNAVRVFVRADMEEILRSNLQQSYWRRN